RNVEEPKANQHGGRGQPGYGYRAERQRQQRAKVAKRTAQLPYVEHEPLASPIHVEVYLMEGLPRGPALNRPAAPGKASERFDAGSRRASTHTSQCQDTNKTHADVVSPIAMTPPPSSITRNNFSFSAYNTLHNRKNLSSRLSSAQF